MDKRGDGRKTYIKSRSRRLRIASLLLLIFLSALFAGCYETLLLPPAGSETDPVISGASPTRSILPNDITPALSPTPSEDLETISEHELVIYIMRAINDPGLAASMYDRIWPNLSNTEAPTYIQFQEYVYALHNALGISIAGITPMTEPEARSYLNEMRKNNPEIALANEESVFFWLELATLTRRYNRFPFVVQRTADGVAVLTRAWVSDSLKLLQRAELYFLTLHSGYTDNLSKLLSSEVPTHEIRRYKAELTIDYYRENVVPDNHQLVSLRADALQFLQVLNDPQSSSVTQAEYRKTRSMQIVNLGEENYKIDDRVPQKIPDSFYRLYLPSGRAITLNAMISNYSLSVMLDAEPQDVLISRLPGSTSTVGTTPTMTAEGDTEPSASESTAESGTTDPISTSAEEMSGTTKSDGDRPGPVESTDAAPDDLWLIQVDYPGLRLYLSSDTPQEENSFAGTVIAMLITNPDYQLGTFLCPGISKEEILNKWPFADLSSYSLQGEQGQRITILFTDGIVDGVHVTMPEGRAFIN
ncbi:MAG: hypothetical protein GX907_00310 [Clostridiaceae bacterium]|nr:hypothetical protein [Clostridiaceae bacterium]